MERRSNAIDHRFDAIDRRFRAIQARIDQGHAQLNARIDGTLRYAITFSLSLLGVVATVATGILALRW